MNKFTKYRYTKHYPWRARHRGMVADMAQRFEGRELWPLSGGLSMYRSVCAARRLVARQIRLERNARRTTK